MDFFTNYNSIVEMKIKEAQKNGEFDNLPLKNQPLVFDDSDVPLDLRAGFKIMKNAGVLPEEMQLKKEIYNLEQLIAGSTLNDAELKSEKTKLFEKIIRYKEMTERNKK